MSEIVVEQAPHDLAASNAEAGSLLRLAVEWPILPVAGMLDRDVQIEAG